MKRSGATATLEARGLASEPIGPELPSKGWPTPRRPSLRDAGLFFIVVAAPLCFFPQSRAPFADLKLLVIALGALLLWLSSTPVDRRLAPAAGLFTAAVAVSSILGVDPWASLLGAQATGLVTLALAALLLIQGSGLSHLTVDRVRAWLVAVGVSMAAVAVLAYLAPGLVQAVTPKLTLRGSTMGNPVFLAGFLTASTVAALGAAYRRPSRLIPVLAVLASGFAVLGERSAIISPAVALLVGLVLTRSSRALALQAVATFSIVFVLWSTVPQIGTGAAGSPASETARQLQTLTGERQRIAVASATLRASTRRPIAGWGPANTWSAFVASAAETELRTAGRGWGDSHNVFLEMLVTTGIVGLGALAFLVLRTVRAALRPPPALRWTAGAAVALGVYHLYEPLNVLLTPLMFLLAGMAASRSVPSLEISRRKLLASRRWGRAPRAAIAGALCAAIVLAAGNLAASALEQWGRTHFAEWALRTSLAVQPWRTSAAESLAINRALDARSGEEGAAQEARHLIEGAVRQHPWDPGVRLVAAGVEQLLNHHHRAKEWIEEHLQRFPHDTIAEAPRQREVLLRPVT